MSKAKKIFCIVVLCLAVMAGLVYGGIYISYHKLTVNEFTMESEKLDEAVTLVVLADLHNHEFGEGNQELVAQVLAQDADAILMVGDFINRDSAGADVLLEMASELMKAAPVYFAWGNHELGYMKAQEQVVAAADDISSGAGTFTTATLTTGTLQQELEALGVVVLDQAWQDVEIGGQAIRIGGLYDYAFALDGWNSCNPDKMVPEVYQFLCEYQETDVFKLMLAHRPDSFIFGAASKTWDVDLVVSGHVHGGQVVVPFLGGLWSGDQGWFPEYDHGLYEKDLLHIFITSGLGSNKKAVPRFNNPPEIAVLQLVPVEE